MAPNRKVAAGTALTALLAGLASLLGAIDTTQQAVAFSVALVVLGAVAVVWLLGWQKHEARNPDVANTLTQIAAGLGVLAPSTEATDAADIADEEPGDPDSLPELPTTSQPDGLDGDDQVHGR